MASLKAWAVLLTLGLLSTVQIRGQENDNVVIPGNKVLIECVSLEEYNPTSEEKKTIPNILKTKSVTKPPKKNELSFEIVIERLLDPNLYFVKKEITLNYYELFQNNINLSIKPSHLGKIWKIDVVYDPTVYELVRFDVVFIPKNPKTFWKLGASYTSNSFTLKLFL